jgi:hypothetical protein
MLYLMELDQPALIHLLEGQYKIPVGVLYRYFDILLDILKSFYFYTPVILSKILPTQLLYKYLL